MTRRLAGEVVGELADARRHMPRRAIMRDHVARLAGVNQHRTDIAHPDEANHPRRGIDARHRHCAAAGRRQRAMDPLDYDLAPHIGVVRERPHGGLRRARCLDTVARAIDHHDRATVNGVAP